jgi:HKD family nuclease
MQIETVTAPAGGMLAAVRSVLDHGDQALLCVAFAQTRGVHLIRDELKDAANRGSARVLVTTFGSTAPVALAAIQQTGADLRVLNPVGGTYHPKVYLGRSAKSIHAVVGSVNLTSGLVANIEVATVMRGSSDDQPLAELWNWAETTWSHARARAWTGVVKPGEDEEIEPELLAMLSAVARESPRVYTLGPSAAENVVSDVMASGLLVETARSRERSAGPQLIPPRMLNLAWDTLRARGRLSNREMLEELRIHRSSFVCAVLARLPGVRVDPGRTIVLRYSNPAEA